MKITRKQLLQSALAASVSAVLQTPESADAAPTATGNLPAQRVAAIAPLLPDAPRGFGPPCRGDRAEWDALRKRPAFAKAIPNAENTAHRALPGLG